jgi:transposase
MAAEAPAPTRWVGLDSHKHYLVALGVNAHLDITLPQQRVPLERVEGWIAAKLTRQDAVVLEMTTNAWQLYDELVPHVHSVILVHPPHVALIVRSQVMTDKIAAFTLARLHCKGLFTGIWVPPEQVRDLRATLAERTKMTRLATQAKNRLHAVLHRHHLAPPEGAPFLSQRREWWLGLPVSPLERQRIACDLDTLAFAEQQTAALGQTLTTLAADEQRLVLLIQLPGISLLVALTILAAIGDIRRFPDAKHLVGYAGLGARIHDSGQTTRTGRITKTGRRDLRAGMVEAAQSAANTHPHWQAELARLEPRLGRNKAIVAIARKLLVAVWHVLTEGCADRYAEPERVARKLLAHAYRLGRARRPDHQGSALYVRQQLDRLHLGAHLSAIHWGQRRVIPLPPSQLAQPGDPPPAA